VVDTHILTNAVRARLDQGGELGEELRLLEAIKEICCEIVFVPRQAKESAPHFQRIPPGPRFPAQAGILQVLEEAGKIFRPPASRYPKLTRQEQALFRARGHADVQDDMPLYAVAKRYGRLIITNDDGQLRQRELWRQRLGVEVITPAEALEDAAGSS
jgi:hypothetical protein